jgi:hypothetical protein
VGFFGQDGQTAFNSSGQEPVAVARGDFNGDGKMDWAVVRRLGDALDVFINGTGSTADVCVATVVGVNICSPVSGSSSAPEVKITARAKGNATITRMKAYLDGIEVASSFNDLIDTRIANVGAAPHALVVNAWDRNGQLYQARSSFSVAVNGAPCGAGANMTIHVCSPASSTVASPVQFSLRARWDGTTLTHSRIYIDGVDRCDASGGSIACSLDLAQGQHTMTAITWNSAGSFLKTTRTLTVP